MTVGMVCCEGHSWISLLRDVSAWFVTQRRLRKP